MGYILFVTEAMIKLFAFSLIKDSFKPFDNVIFINAIVPNINSRLYNTFNISIQYLYHKINSSLQNLLNAKIDHLSLIVLFFWSCNEHLRVSLYRVHYMSFLNFIPLLSRKLLGQMHIRAERHCCDLVFAILFHL